MIIIVEAVYELGVFKLLVPLDVLKKHERADYSVTCQQGSPSSADIGSISTLRLLTRSLSRLSIICSPNRIYAT